MTLPTLQSWPDFDDDGDPLSATVLGHYGEPIAIVLTSEHHDAFLRIALAAPDLLAALDTLMGLIEMTGPRRIADYKLPIEAARAAIAKAKGL